MVEKIKVLHYHFSNSNVVSLLPHRAAYPERVVGFVRDTADGNPTDDSYVGHQISHIITVCCSYTYHLHNSGPVLD